MHTMEGRGAQSYVEGEGEIQVKYSYVEGGGCRACCLVD